MQKQEFVKKISAGREDCHILDINLLESKGMADIKKLPFSIRILIENLMRKLDGRVVKEEDLLNIAEYLFAQKAKQ